MLLQRARRRNDRQTVSHDDPHGRDQPPSHSHRTTIHTDHDKLPIFAGVGGGEVEGTAARQIMMPSRACPGADREAARVAPKIADQGCDLGG
jgi:hypothetical protein